MNAQKTTASQPTTETSSQSTSNGAEEMQVEPVSLPNENANPQPPETVMDETILRVTRGRLRKTRSTVGRSTTS